MLWHELQWSPVIPRDSVDVEVKSPTVYTWPTPHSSSPWEDFLTKIPPSLNFITPLKLMVLLRATSITDDTRPHKIIFRNPIEMYGIIASSFLLLLNTCLSYERILSPKLELTGNLRTFSDNLGIQNNHLILSTFCCGGWFKKYRSFRPFCQLPNHPSLIPCRIGLYQWIKSRR